jgi:1,4-alpha-glucan branching enzyme
VGNLGAVEAEERSWHGLPASTTLRVPPLGAIWLRYSGEVTKDAKDAKGGAEA